MAFGFGARFRVMGVFYGDEDRDKKSEGRLTLCQDPAAHP